MKKIMFFMIWVALILTPLMAQAGIVAEYSFEGNLFDTGANGTIADNLVPALADEETYGSGVVGLAIRTGYDTGYVAAVHSADLDIPGQYTIEAFINQEARNEQWSRLLLKWEPEWSIHIAVQNGSLGLHHCQSNSAFAGVYPAALTLNKWHHIAITADGSTITVWLDGNPAGSTSYNGTIKSSPLSRFTIGGGDVDSGSRFVGLIDEVRVHNTAMDSAYIKSRAAMLDALNYRAINPTPPNGATGVPFDASQVSPGEYGLTWESPGTVTSPAYDVYMGTDPASLAQVATNLTTAFFDPGTGAPMTKYYWRVDTHYGGNLYPGTTWSFTTGGKISNPQPVNGAFNIPTDTDLSWTGDDFATAYNVYFGTDPNKVRDATTGSTEYVGQVTEPEVLNASLPALAEGAMYYWRVDEVVGGSPLVAGDVTAFTTRSLDLVLHWALDEGSGTVALDSGSYGNGGSIVNDPNWATGIMGSCLQFKGGADEVVLNDANNLPVGAKDSFSINMFLYMDTAPTSLTLLGGFGNPQAPAAEPGTARYLLEFSGGIYSWGDSGAADLATGVPFTVGNWQMITITYDGFLGQVKVFKNGHQIGSGGVSLNDAVADVYLAPLGQWGGAGNYAGKIDDFRIYAGTLNADEMTALMPFASDPFPANGAIEVPTDVTLEWTSGKTAVTHNLIVSMNSDLSSPIVDVTGLTEPGYALAGLGIDTTYYWRADEVTASGVVEGVEIWSFTTVPPKAYAPSPANGVTGADVNADLSWTAGAGGTYTHNVYFGAVAPANMVLVSEEQSATTYDPGTMDYAKTYFWRIDEVTGTDVYPGNIWSFTTVVPVCKNPPVGDITGDCAVNLEDFAELAASWMECGLDIQDACP